MSLRNRRGLSGSLAIMLAGNLVALGIPLGARAQVPPGAAPSPQQPQQPGANIAVPPMTNPEVMGPSDNLGQQSVPTEEPVDPSTYFCGAGDVLLFHVWGRQNIRQRLVVDLEGRVFIPKVGYVQFAGKTLAAARTALKSAVARYYPNVEADISLITPRRFVVHVTGAVKTPGTYEATPLNRVSTVLALAGGVTEGSLRRIEARRRDGVVARVDLLRYRITGDRSLNPFVTDGVVVNVPFPELTVLIEGPVNRPGRYELIGTKDLAEVVELAGGLRSAVTRRLPIRIARRGQNDQRRFIELKFPPTGLPSIDLRDDDEVYIPGAEELQRSVLLYGAVVGADPADEITTVKRLPFLEGDTVRTLIDRAGGIVAAGDLKNAYIQPRDGSKVTPVNLEAILVDRDFSEDRPVRQGDTLVIPYARRSVRVEGAVVHPGSLQFTPSLPVRTYINMAGGPSRLAQDLEAARIVHANGTIEDYSGRALAQPGDTIVVPERNFSRSEVVSLVMSGVSLALTAVLVGVQVFK